MLGVLGFDAQSDVHRHIMIHLVRDTQQQRCGVLLLPLELVGFIPKFCSHAVDTTGILFDLLCSYLDCTNRFILEIVLSLVHAHSL